MTRNRLTSHSDVGAVIMEIRRGARRFLERRGVTAWPRLKSKKASILFPGLPIESVIDFKQCQFTKKLLKVNPKIFGAIIREDSSIITDIYDIISVNLIKILDRIEIIHNEIDNELTRIFGPDSSWTAYLVDNNGFNEYLGAKRLKPDFIKNFLNLIKKIHGMYQEISGKSLIESYDGCKKIHTQMHL